MRAMRRSSQPLGRGLAVLLGDAPETAGNTTFQLVSVDTIEPSPSQPRRIFNHDSLHALAQSLTSQGLIHPLLVRPHPHIPGRYTLIAGERRWRAAQIAGLQELPVILRDLDDAEAFECTLIENVQRADLDPIEEAEAYRAMMQRFGHSQEALAQRVGKSREHIANMIRLLNLSAPIQALIAEGKLSAGHGRALLMASSQDIESLAQEAAQKKLSVRATEKRARGSRSQTDPPLPTHIARQKQAERGQDIHILQSALNNRLGLDVSLSHRGSKGCLSIHFSTRDQLEDLVVRLIGRI